MTIFEKAKQLNGEWIDHDKYGYSRTIRFEANGYIYAMELWPHTSYLFCGAAAISFDDFYVVNDRLQLYYHGYHVGTVSL